MAGSTIILELEKCFNQSTQSAQGTESKHPDHHWKVDFGSMMKQSETVRQHLMQGLNTTKQ